MGTDAPPQDVAAWLAAAQARLQAGDAEGARRLMGEAANAGSVIAAVQLGIWELIGLGGPTDVEGAVRRLRGAADRGHPAAAALSAQLAVSVAAERGGDFDTALSLLIGAAEAGEPRAALQLAILVPAGGPGDADRATLLRHAASVGEPIARTFLERWPEAPAGAPLDWGRLRERVALPHERAVPEPESLSAAPRIAALRGLFTREECIYVGLKGLPLLRPARVVTPDGRSVVDPMRSNETAKFGLLEADVVVQSLDLRVARALGHPAANGEGFALLRYETGQQYLPHCDWIDPEREATRPDLERWGQRVATCVVYLNDGFEGGATEFPRLGLSFRGGVGDALLWDNVRPDGAVDPETLHAGRPPASGMKYLLSKWMRDKSQAGNLA